MKETRSKYIFNSLSALLLVLMLYLSKNAGISCDEVLHYNQSVAVYNYFATHGNDKSALNTPETFLKYYGQSYDNIATILTKWFGIEDVYSFRHIMSSAAGWLAIYITALFAVWISGYNAGILVIILFAISPTFMGHAQNNLKDIPFALSYIAGIFFSMRFIMSGKKNSWLNLVLLTLSIAFSISLRAGGLILICYLFFFFFVYNFYRYLNDREIYFKELRNKLLLICCVTVISWFLSIIIWPFALQSPIKNVIVSYQTMAHYPLTFKQIFEGRVEWSDFMPWYYLPKSIFITVPVLILAGFLLFCFVRKSEMPGEKKLVTWGILFTIIFPVIFVILEKSNLYSSWRQFLFIYPGIIILSALGFVYVYDFLKPKYLKWGYIFIFLILLVHPLKFMIRNPQLYYIYYNQLVGGLDGAYSNYETDYYYTSQTEASKWLIEYLKKKDRKDKIKVKATYSVEWQFRKHPEIETSYFRYEERSTADWDYAIVTNRYISPFQLRSKLFPPQNAIHVIYADNIPVCAVLERKTKEDYEGYQALLSEKYEDAVSHFRRAVKIDDGDEMIFYNFAAALYNTGQYQKADSVLKRGLEINPDFTLILMYLGNIAKAQNRQDDAVLYYEKVIKADRRYFDAYVELSEMLIDKDVKKARDVLNKCLEIDPDYKPAIVAMADTYRKSDPGKAKKYDELAGKIN